MKNSLTPPRLSILSVLLVLNLFVGACSTERKSDSPEHLESIVLMGTNDLHGTLEPLALKTREKPGITSIAYEAGGLAYLASYVKILRNEFREHFIWLDGGDQYQGSIESNFEFGSPMVSFFNLNGLNASAVGNHEFDFGLPILKTRMTEAQFTYLAANLENKMNGELPPFPHLARHKLIQAGKLKVGILGLSTLETPVTTRAIHVKDLQFMDLVATTLHNVEAMRKQGANVILLTAHSGLKCELNHTIGRSIRRETDPQGVCGDNDEIVKLLQALPPHTIDAVVSGHTHQIVHHWIAGTPVIQGGAFGKYFNIIYLTYDWNQKKVVPDLTRIEGPIPVCNLVFQNQNDCNGDRPAPKNGRGPLVSYKFHGEMIQRNQATDQLIQPIVVKNRPIKEKVISNAKRPIEHSRYKECEFGNLVADALRYSVRANFGYMNAGGIRDSLEAGDITYGALFRALPFENYVAKLHLTVEELKMIFRVAQNGSRGFGAVSGIRLRLLDPRIAAPFSDLNHDGKLDPWENNRLIDLVLDNGDKLDPNKIYTLATSDFLVTGGDDLKWAMSQIPSDRIEMETGKSIRDSVIEYLNTQPVWNTHDRDLLDSHNPRLQFIKKKFSAARRRPGKKRSSQHRVPESHS